MTSKILSVDFEIYGHVQGVNFRKSTRKEATNLGLKGWCMNTDTGTVKGSMQGESSKIQEMKKWLQYTGSPQSKIENAVFSNEKEIEEYTYKDFQCSSMKMENSTAVSGRRRATTKHSVEDQALDQIAKEESFCVWQRHKVWELAEEVTMESTCRPDPRTEEDKNSSSSDDSPLKNFYDDLVDTDSDDPGGEDSSCRKVLSGAEKEALAPEGRADVRRDSKLIMWDFEYKTDKNESGDSDTEEFFDPVLVEDDADGGSGDVVCCPLCSLCVPGFERCCDHHRDMLESLKKDFSREYIVDFLGKESDKAEARLAARRQARVEAREIRLRELERQQKEQEENADKVFDMSLASENLLRSGRVAPLGLLNAKDRPSATVNSYHSSRRSSEDSLEDGSYSLRDIKHELKELDEKFRKAMIANAQLDNEKSELTYQVELLKDRLEDLEETHAQLTRENREKCREHEQLKRVAVKLKEELAFYKSQLEERDKLIADYGLVIVGGEGGEDGGTSERILVSSETAGLLQQAGDGSLDVRLKKFAEERNELVDEVRHLKLELEEERNKKRSDGRSGYGSLTNGPLDEETSKILSDYRFKLQKAEQDVSTLQANVARLESQVIRYKSAAESSEKAEDELKMEKRKLQRENRESIARIEELETANSHLMRRMDKLKNAKSTLLKEL